MDPVSKAQNSPDTPKPKRGHGPGRPWPKGVSGNPGGRPKKLYISEMFENILKSGANRKDIEDSLLSILKGGRMASVLLVREMAERTEGKVTQPVDGNVNLNVEISEIIREVRERKLEYERSGK